MRKTVSHQLHSQWYRKLVSLFVGLTIASCMAIFDRYWWKESFVIGYCTVAVAVIVDLLLPQRMRLLRFSLQLASAVYITFRFARVEYAISPPGSTSDLAWWVQQHLAQIHPFLWISLTLLGIHFLFSAWATTRMRMAGFVAAALLMLTVTDSFTPIWLWDNVALVVFIGLLWLIVSHLAKLQTVHPESLKHLLQYPAGLIVSIVIVFSLFMLIGLNVPSLAPLVQDPYTIWKNSRGEEVQLFLGDKAVQSNDSSSPKRSASSGYSRNDDVLGGGFNFDYSPMMTIATNRKSYWRGETKGIYTGEGWTEAERGNDSRTMQSIGRNELLSDGDGRSLAQTVEIDYTVTMIREDVYPVLFNAAPVSSVKWLDTDTSPIPSQLRWLPQYWELKFQGKVDSYPESYALTSAVTVLDEEGLKQVSSLIEDNRQEAYYTQLPDALPARVRQLAEAVTAEGASDYEKAKLLESYLSQTYTYTNKPDLSKLSGQSDDFVDQFLFELKEGYCDYFSTAMAVMARSLGMPSRWVKGFAPGSLPNTNTMPDELPYGVEAEESAEQAGIYTIRNSDAHSWVEIYFDGYGWISFEPTAGFIFPYTLPTKEETPVEELDTDDKETTVPEPEQGASDSSLATLWLWLAILSAAALLGGLLFYRRARIAALWEQLREGSYTANERIILETERLLRICKRKGLRREEHETLREAALRWSKHQKWLKDDFVLVVDGFEQAKYGAAPFSKEESHRLIERIRQLIVKLK
ncbi:transglutaminase domain-containing protein [Paenibacillus sp. HB172176]|uniref:transglutaminase TgpA family protein n=1 Tax=Paenibacillus sp. HB172176 TaxID=2493690 RepID=UPI00143A1BD4|nr:transglutaminase domain-containing protein [Paenibacillus sp. HB172176]